jgi:hypothetical protein
MIVFLKILLGLLTVLFSFIGIGITILTSKNIINEDAIQKVFDTHPDKYQSLRGYTTSEVNYMLKVMGWMFIGLSIGFIFLIIIL